MAWNFVRLRQDRSSFKYGEELSRRGPSKTHRSWRGGFGPRRLGPGCDGIDRSEIDAAILDVHLGDEFAPPVADRLDELAIPFVLTTGHTGRSFPLSTPDLRFVKSRPNWQRSPVLCGKMISGPR